MSQNEVKTLHASKIWINKLWKLFVKADFKLFSSAAVEWKRLRGANWRTTGRKALSENISHLQVLAGHNVMYRFSLVTLRQLMFYQSYITLGQPLFFHPLLQVNSTLMLLFLTLSDVMLILLVNIGSKCIPTSRATFGIAQVDFLLAKPRGAQILNEV